MSEEDLAIASAGEPGDPMAAQLLPTTWGVQMTPARTSW